MKYLAIILASTILLSCDDGPKRPKGMTGAEEQATLPATWHVGPIIGGKNYSEGIAPIPALTEAGLPIIEISQTSEPHYVTYRYGSLAGKSQIKMRYKLEGTLPDPVLSGCATLDLYFQAADPYWLTDGNRWWASFGTISLVPNTEGEIVAPLTAKFGEGVPKYVWTGVETFNAVDNQGRFDEAKFNADRVGFTFGDCIGRGHGVTANQPMKFTVLEFTVE